MVKILYIGHSAFFIKGEKSAILIDPFIGGNPGSSVNFSLDEVKDIIVTHGHADHLGDAIPISKKTGAPISAIVELASYCSSKGAKAEGMNMGGKNALNGASVKFLPAFHSSSTPEGGYAGMPASVLIEIDGLKIYHAGDTCLNTEMKVVGEVYGGVDYALLPIGSFYTMDSQDALTAARWLKAKKVIPMHYNTFPVINADVEEFKKHSEIQGVDCIILKPGESLQI